MTEAALNSYYNESFGSKRHMQGQIVNARINSWVIQEFMNIHPAMTLLDIGTGYGFFMKELQDKTGVIPSGVELSKQEVDYGTRNLGLDIRNSLLGESGLNSNFYDIVTCFEVIEHIPDPRSFMTGVAGYIKPDGYLLIMTDNFESGVAKSLGAGFPKWIPHSHISHFSPVTFENVVKSANLKIIGRMSYTPWELLLRNYYYIFKGIKKRPEEAFQLSSVLESEMEGTYKFFNLRKSFNKIWSQVTLRKNLDGALMYILAQRN